MDAGEEATVTITDQRAALEHVYRSEAPGLTRYFSLRVAEPADAVDLVQESFARLAGRMCRGVLVHPASYLQRIARNLLLDRGRSAALNAEASHSTSEIAMDVALEPEQSQRLEAQDIMRLYQQALDALPDRTRTIFLLHRVQEMPYREIAVQLGVSVPTIQYHVAKALVHIATTLDLG